ncbi:hypothetical protein V6N11_071440 [Hibiscus sabdariffa]|uniref:Uncharacterized protein n=1 Tax=Hibiscus sabdariffa TaxID=183260 RepID=A0ABR2U0M7_9ROSI
MFLSQVSCLKISLIRLDVGWRSNPFVQDVGCPVSHILASDASNKYTLLTISLGSSSLHRKDLMAPRKVFERNKRTQSICKDRRTIQEPQIVFDGSNQTQEAETEQVLGELNRTQEHELQQVHNAPNQTHDDINPDITVDNSAKLSSEIGIISRQFTPIPTKWKDMKDNYKFHALERLKSKFEMKLDDDYVKTSVMSIMSKLSRNHRHQRNDDQEPNRMDFFKATHYSNEKGWTSSNAQTTYEKMVELQSTPVEEGAEPKTIDNIVDEVLGTRSGYIPGLGYGPKPKKNSSANTIDLEKSLKNKEDELKVYKSNFEMIQTQMEAMRSALLAAGIQVPSLQFSASNDATNSSSTESQPTQTLD